MTPTNIPFASYAGGFSSIPLIYVQEELVRYVLRHQMRAILKQTYDEANDYCRIIWNMPIVASIFQDLRHKRSQIIDSIDRKGGR